MIAEQWDQLAATYWAEILVWQGRCLMLSKSAAWIEQLGGRIIIILENVIITR